MGIGTGYPIADEAFGLEVYKLACTFAASRKLAQLGRKHYGINGLRETFELSEAARQLISVAAMVRSKLDTKSVIRPSSLSTAISTVVGELTPDLSLPGQKHRLEFREACHKILHADDIDLAKTSEPPGSSIPLTDTITLFGTKRSGKKNQEWEARLDLPRFLDAASFL